MTDNLGICICENCEFRDVIFPHIEQEEVKELCAHKKEKQYRRGEIIHHQGDKITDFKYLKKGLVKIFRPVPGGDEQIVTITRPFEFVSNVSFFTEEHYKYSIAALEDSTICVVALKYMQQLFSNNAPLAMSLLSKVSGINEKIISQSLEIRNKNLVGRVAYVLLFFAREVYSSRVFDLPVSRKEIADFISMSTANVIRTFSEFKKEGIINVEGKMIEVIDFDKLDLLAKRG